MKIIKGGVFKTPENKLENYWWLNYNCRCKNCYCIFQLERADFPKFITAIYTVTNHDHSKKETGIHVNCPYCEVLVQINKPKPIVPTKSLFGELFGEGGTFEKIFGKL